MPLPIEGAESVGYQNRTGWWVVTDSSAKSYKLAITPGAPAKAPTDHIDITSLIFML